MAKLKNLNQRKRTPIGEKKLIIKVKEDSNSD